MLCHGREDRFCNICGKVTSHSDYQDPDSDGFPTAIGCVVCWQAKRSSVEDAKRTEWEKKSVDDRLWELKKSMEKNDSWFRRVY